MQEMRYQKGGDCDAVRRGAVNHMAVALTLTAMLGVIGFLAADTVARSATRTTATVSLHKTKLGLILVNSKGHTLYMFGKDKNGKSACSGSCVKFWPPLIRSGKPTAGPGVKASMLGMTKRSNGSLQLTYDKHPLYSFALDKAGQTNGEGNLAFGARWYAVSARGTAVVKASTTPTTTKSTTTTTCRYPPC